MDYSQFNTAPVGFGRLQATLNPEEQSMYTSYWQQVSGMNRLEGPAAAVFLKRSGLPVEMLREIWNISTPGNETFLDQDRFFVALKLVALAQEGKEVSKNSIIRGDFSGLPRFIDPAQIWTISPEEETDYLNKFNKAGGAKGFLEKSELNFLADSKLPTDYLKKIWMLCDPRDTGIMNKEQFIVALHIISRFQIYNEPVPTNLPQSLSALVTRPESIRRSISSVNSFEIEESFLKDKEDSDIQDVMKKWNDVRSKLSAERERSKILLARLSNAVNAVKNL